MQFLKRLFSKSDPPKTLTSRLFGPGSFEVGITVLSVKNLDVFWNATSNQWQRKEDEKAFYELQTEATVTSDIESNIPNAIGVEIGGQMVGQLAHADALRFNRRLKELGYQKVHSRCEAMIVGRKGHWQVYLNLDTSLPGANPVA